MKQKNLFKGAKKGDMYVCKNRLILFYDKMHRVRNHFILKTKYNEQYVVTNYGANINADNDIVGKVILSDEKVDDLKVGDTFVYDNFLLSKIVGIDEKDFILEDNGLVFFCDKMDKVSGVYPLVNKLSKDAVLNNIKKGFIRKVKAVV